MKKCANCGLECHDEMLSCPSCSSDAFVITSQEAPGRSLPPLKNLSRKTVVAVSLVAWFVPSLFLLFQMAKNGGTALKNLEFLPMMYGFTLAMWFRVLLQQHWFQWTFVVIVSVGLPVLLVVLMLRTSRWRPLVLVVGLILSCALTAATYCMLLA